MSDELTLKTVRENKATLEKQLRDLFTEHLALFVQNTPGVHIENIHIELIDVLRLNGERCVLVKYVDVGLNLGL